MIPCEVRLDAALNRRVNQWSRKEQVELSALVSILREYGLAGIKIREIWPPDGDPRVAVTVPRIYVFERTIAGRTRRFQLHAYTAQNLILRGGV